MGDANMTDSELREAWLAVKQRQSLEKNIMLKAQSDQYAGLCATHEAELAPLSEAMRERDLFWKPKAR